MESCTVKMAVLGLVATLVFSAGASAAPAAAGGGTVNAPAVVASAGELAALLAPAIEGGSSRLALRVNGPAAWMTDATVEGAVKSASDASVAAGPFLRSWSWSWRGNASGRDLAFSFKWDFPDAEIATRVAEARRRAEEVVAALIGPGMSDFDKELALHDWLARSARYNGQAYDSGLSGPGDNNPYGVLILGTGVCESYATAFRLLATTAGLECLVIDGRGRTGSHSWNLVRIDGEWYHLDVTYDDPRGQDLVLHDYLNVPDALIAADHAWDPTGLPRAGSDRANYWNARGRVLPDMSAFGKAASTFFAERQTEGDWRLAAFPRAGFGASVGAALEAAAKGVKTRLSYSYSFNPYMGTIRLSAGY